MGNLLGGGNREYATVDEIGSQPNELRITVSEGQWYYSTLFQITAKWLEEKSFDITLDKLTTLSEFLSLLRLRCERSPQEPLRLTLETSDTVESSPYALRTTDPVPYIDCTLNENEPIVRLRFFNMCQVKVSFTKKELHEDRII